MINSQTSTVRPPQYIQVKNTRIAIFDDNRNIRNSITMLLHAQQSLDVVGIFSHANNCVENVLDCQPDVIIMDIQMPGINGIEAIQLLKKEIPDVKILVQTIFEDDDYIMSAIMAGAYGYILKSQLNEKLIDSIREILSDGSPFSPLVARKILDIIRHGIKNVGYPPTNYNLTVREKEVLTCIVDGLSHKMIASKLNISYETVRSHVKKIYEKMNVSSLTEVVAKAINQHLV